MIQWRKSIAALAGLCLVTACQQNEKAGGEPRSVASEQAPPLPVIDPVLDREALIFAVMHAASDTAQGRVDEDEQRRLDGKRFTFRIRFGCGGPAAENSNAARRWRFDPKRRVLTVTVEPDITDAQPLPLPELAEAYEAAEGFWLVRPWILKSGCPAVPTPASPPDAASSSEPAAAPSVTPSGSASPVLRVGIAQFFSATDARTHRRGGRAYETTATLDQAEAPSESGYDLVVSGRLQRLSDGKVIACRQLTPAAPPACIVSAQFDNVAIEVPATGKIIAQWSGA